MASTVDDQVLSEAGFPRHKWTMLALLALAALLVVSLWFSASAVVPQLTGAWQLSAGQQSWLTMSVQIGFVVGALGSTLLTLADRVPAERLFAVSAVLGAFFNGAIALFATAPEPALFLRFLTGVTLAGVYPPGMKLIATWTKEDRGLGIGLLVGALTVGSAMPHLLNAVPIFGGATGIPAWRPVLLAASALALLGAFIVTFWFKPGPFLSQSAPFDWRYAGSALSDRPVRLANFGYLGHMWELYAMWAWTPLFILAAYQAAGWSETSARVAAFAVIAIGGVGSIVAGKLADRLGRTAIAGVSLALSGACALTIGFFFDRPALLTALALIWGFTVVADSAQFSAAVSELSDARYVGTALTLQTSLGFLLTLFTIRMVPPLAAQVGWHWAFAALAIGPVFGLWSMLALRSLPEATKMASGKR